MKLTSYIICLFFALVVAAAAVTCIETDNTKTNKLISLKDNNFVILRGEINGLSASNVVHQLNKFKKGDEIYLYIMSGGGSVIDGNEIVQSIKDLTSYGVKINCIANMAMSMAFVIFQSCPTRYITESSILMQHQMSIQLKGPIENVKQYLDFTNNLNEQINLKQSQVLGLDPNEFHKKTEHDWWLYGSDIVKNKAADEIISVICDFNYGQTVEEHYTFFGPVKLTFSSCPLVRSPLKVSFGALNDIKTENINEKLDNYVNSLYDVHRMVITN